MKFTPNRLLQIRIVQVALKTAWNESNPGITGGHEEGGFILQRPSGDIFVQRWSVGTQSQITVPPHHNCRIDENELLASFHTHPNTGSDYLQEPSATDKRAVRDDPNLKGRIYLGEFVVANQAIYLIQTGGEVFEVGSRRSLLEEN